LISGYKIYCYLININFVHLWTFRKNLEMEINKLLCEKLLQIKAIKLSPQTPFTWASGIKSPIYCDNRVTLSYPEVRNLVKMGLAEVAKTFEGVDAIAGVATAGIAHGALLADHLNLPFAYVRAEAKSHGRKNKIEGDLSSAKNILVVEDLISTGGSSIQVIDILRDEGYNVAGLIAIFDYGFEVSKQNFSSKNVVYKTITNYQELIKVAAETNYIAQSEIETLESWSNDIENWGK
jgi:orotate phosphoribosyltransferase